MSDAALSIRPVPPNTDKELIFSEIQVEPSEVRDMVQVGDTVYIVFGDLGLRDRIEFLNQSELFNAETIIQKETLDTFASMKNPPPAQSADLPPPQISTFISDDSADAALLGKLQTTQFSVHAPLPADDAYLFLRNHFGLVTLAILTVVATFALIA